MISRTVICHTRTHAKSMPLGSVTTPQLPKLLDAATFARAAYRSFPQFRKWSLNDHQAEDMLADFIVFMISKNYYQRYDSSQASLGAFITRYAWSFITHKVTSAQREAHYRHKHSEDIRAAQPRISRHSTKAAYDVREYITRAAELLPSEQFDVVAMLVRTNGHARRSAEALSLSTYTFRRLAVKAKLTLLQFGLGPAAIAK